MAKTPTGEKEKFRSDFEKAKKEILAYRKLLTDKSAADCNQPDSCCSGDGCCGSSCCGEK